MGPSLREGGTLGPVVADFELERGFSVMLAASFRPQVRTLPLKREVAAFVDDLLGLLFPQLAEEPVGTADEIEARLHLVRCDLAKLLGPIIEGPRAEEISRAFARELPNLHSRIALDADAIVAGDPAAESLDEVVAAYPGFLAIAAHRVAHQILQLGVPVLPRLVSEVAHTRTGIDIHPGASIGNSFCIDHGTGIVVGETAVIGDFVKIYQGVTLGALSVAKSAAGSKRHPTIEDRVVIYANATVLGGDTVVGHDSVVGGNVWLTSSVPPYSLVYHASQVRVRSVTEDQEPVDFVI
ncbi:MAG TPA: serine O-acetyltransferase [Candidatus Dormibacteraeota bacterium]|nr:serine O-acetyltransferase [Candidatus Dormibacteraeota bacterium]